MEGAEDWIIFVFMAFSFPPDPVILPLLVYHLYEGMITNYFPQPWLQGFSLPLMLKPNTVRLLVSIGSPLGYFVAF